MLKTKMVAIKITENKAEKALLMLFHQCIHISANMQQANKMSIVKCIKGKNDGRLGDFSNNGCQTAEVFLECRER